MSEHDSITTTKDILSILSYAAVVSVPFEDEDFLEKLKVHWTSEQLVEYFQRKVGDFDRIHDKTKRWQAEQMRTTFSFATSFNAVFEKMERGFTNRTSLHIYFSFSNFKDLCEFNKIIKRYGEALLE